MTKLRYGFIGLGHLGGHLAASLGRAGFPLVVFDLDPTLAERHRKLGAEVAESPQDLAKGVDAVMTCLPSPKVSGKVLDAVLTTANPGTDWIEMSTLGRDDVLALAARAESKRRAYARMSGHRRRSPRRDWRYHRSGRR